MADSALQRLNMVESQVRPSDVTDRRITAAMSEIAREAFLTQDVDPSLAYMDGPLPLAGGRAMLAPRTLARLVQAAGIEADDKVLVIGAGTGYGAALVARLAGTVVALECDKALAAKARETLAGTGNAAVAEGALESGAAGKGPFDVILLEGGVEDVPEALISQLAQSGRLTGIEMAGPAGKAFVLTKSGSTVSRRIVFDATASVLPGLSKVRGFVF